MKGRLIERPFVAEESGYDGTSKADTVESHMCHRAILF